VTRREPLFPNAGIVARREFAERLHSRLFLLSTGLLAALAVLLAFAPLVFRLADRGTTTRIGIAATDSALAATSQQILNGVLGTFTASSGGATYTLSRATDRATALDDVSTGRLDAALVADREPSGKLDFTFYTGEGMGGDRIEVLKVGALAVAILDWNAATRSTGGPAFQLPNVDVVAAAGPTAGGAPLSAADYASRRVIGIVFVVLIFIILVIYGMWVAAGVVAEKASRVMELMISAASARQLVVGKVLGIGAAGLTQFTAVIVPALLALAVEDQVATTLLGRGASVAASLAVLSPALVVACILYFVLGFALYALFYAAAGSLVSRAEDLQILALPLSLVAIVGYLQAVLALSGGSGFTRIASFVPFWSPFVMLTRLTVGRVEPWEVVLSLALLVLAIAVTLVIATRVYAAGVVLYGQRPGLRAIVAAVRHPAT